MSNDTKKHLKELSEKFLSDPTSWPSAMGARALRARAGHPAYSANNQIMILIQLPDDDAVATFAQRASAEIAPASVWAKRGYTVDPETGLLIWSKPVPIWVDPETGDRVRPKTEGARKRSIFRLEKTYTAYDVKDVNGNNAVADYVAPEMPEGEALTVYDRLSAWISAQGWTVSREDTGQANGYTVHRNNSICVHHELAGWEATETLAHEIAHALLHGSDDPRDHREHRGDIEAEAESVVFGLLAAYGQTDLLKGAARYATEWVNGDTQRLMIAFDRATSVLDAMVAVAQGDNDVTVKVSDRVAKAETKASNRSLAAELRNAGLQPRGEAWRRAKAGEPIASIAKALAA